MTGKNPEQEGDLLHMARLALAGRPQDVQTYVRRLAKQYRDKAPEVAEALIGLLRDAPTRSSPLRRGADVSLPVDVDTRFQLLRVEDPPVLDHEPVFEPRVATLLTRLVDERTKNVALLAAGLDPTRTTLFTGPPGVGKTMAARWLARSLQKPLVILDLAAVMSSYLGRTGANLRYVLDYAKSVDCVLLLDELDAIAKRRDDRGEIGELKRLVTVLIQQLDDWPATGLLIAATNHAELLDPAIWRRFEQIIEFPLPTEDVASEFIEARLSGHSENASEWAGILAVALSGNSFSDLDRELKAARRAAALGSGKVEEYLAAMINSARLTKEQRIDVAARLYSGGFVSQRRAQELTGVARETIRSRAAPGRKTRTTEETA